MASRPTQTRRIDVLGAPVDAVSLVGTCQRIASAVQSGDRLVIATVNVDFVMRARREPSFRAALWRTDLVVPDGVPVCWLAALQGDPLAGRVNGTQLAWECGELAARHGFTLGLLGGAEGTAAGAADVLRARYPGSRIEAIPAPDPLTTEHSAGLLREVRARGVEVLLVALGSPKQEYWLGEHLAASGAVVGIGVGASFDFISGRKPRAPRWMQRSGLEWFFRLVHEPRRLGRRYLIDDLPFVWLGLGSAATRRLRRLARAD